MFLIIFSICYIVLNNEIDSDVEEWEGISFFQKAMLQAFRTSIGELGMPKYLGILEQEESFMKSLNLYLIWCVWFIQICFMMIIMLNFLIAVINSTYTRVVVLQKIISYKNKAILNKECYMILSVFKSLPEYKIVVFSTSKSSERGTDDELETVVDSLKKYVSR